MRGRFAFPMQSTGRGIAAAPGSWLLAEQAAPAGPRARKGAQAGRWPQRRSVRIGGTDLPVERRARG